MLSLEDDDTLMLEEDSTLRTAGIGEKERLVVLEGHSLPQPLCWRLADDVWIIHRKVNATLGALYTPW